jgi:hypothetical protein
MSFIFHDVAQNDEIWHALRCGKVTSSSNATFMANADKGTWGEPAKRLALQIALERITGNKSENGFSNDHTERGHAQEPIAKSLYELEYFVNVDNGGFFECGLYGASPDGLVNDDGIIEIKSVIAPVHYANIKRQSHDPSYTWQIVGNLDCTGRDWCDFISFCAEFPEAKQLIVYRLYRKDYLDHIERLRKRRADFLKLIDEIEADILEKDFYKLEKETA